MNELCVSCHYARMRDDICGIYCTGGFVERDGKCKHYKDCEEEWEETGLTREEIVTALRCCASNKCGGCLFCNDDSSCISKMTDEAADLIENQQRHIEALIQANAALRDTVLRRDAQIEKMKEGNNGTTDEEN